LYSWNSIERFNAAPVQKIHPVRQWRIDPLQQYYSLTKIHFMRTSFPRFAVVFTAIAFMAMSFIACKSGPKDEDIQKAVAEKAAAISSDGSGISSTVKDRVVTLSGSFKDDATRTAFETTVKAIPGVDSVVNNSTVVAPPPPPPVAPVPVTISADSILMSGVADATKDFPGVKATVSDGVITLTGEIKRANLKNLMGSLHTLKPKNIDNKLTVK
jgi:hyperosmotically inducible protein